MRVIRVVLTALLSVSLLHAADDLTVLSEEVLGYPPREMLHRYLLKECQKHFDARRQAVAALKTPEDVQRRQRELRHKFIESLGGFPKKTPLNPQVVGILQRDGYRIEKVIYESRPNHHVTANLYLPDPSPRPSPARGEGGKVPGVLVPCGHSVEGKAAEAYQRACILMAKNGLAVLCYDPIGQGERVQLLDKTGKPAIAGSTSEHTMCGIGALLVGRQTASYRIWDGIRSLDYLASRPEVDPTKLGCTGNSGGGTLTAYLMALDDRIVAGAPSCYITSLERLFATIGPQDAEQNITGQVAFGMEHADFITMRAPKPTLICTATKDFFDIQGSWTTFREVKRIYGLLGHGERVDLFEYDDQHGFSKPRREAACRWMLRWLAGRDEAIVEGDFPANQPADLQCTRTGQVLEDLKGKSVFDLNGEREMELAEKRPSHLSQTGNEGLFRRIRDGLRLGTEPGKDVPTFKPGEPITRRGYEITQYTFMPEASIVLPGMSWQQTGLTEYPPEVMYLHDKGMLAGASLDGPFEKYVKAGYGVWTFDLRGLGELAPAPPSSRQPTYFGSDSKEVFLSLHVRRPLLGQRVYDVLATVERLMPEVRKQLHLTAVGSTGPVALHAAALDPRIKQLTLDRSLISWSSVVRTPISVNQLTNVVPGALEYYDLPDLAATLAPRPLTIRNPVDAAGQPVSQEELERVYARAREAYAKANAADKLILEGKK